MHVVLTQLWVVSLNSSNSKLPTVFLNQFHTHIEIYSSRFTQEKNNTSAFRLSTSAHCRHPLCSQTCTHTLKSIFSSQMITIGAVAITSVLRCPDWLNIGHIGCAPLKLSLTACLIQAHCFLAQTAVYSTIITGDLFNPSVCLVWIAYFT